LRISGRSQERRIGICMSWIGGLLATTRKAHGTYDRSFFEMTGSKNTPDER